MNRLAIVSTVYYDSHREEWSTTSDPMCVFEESHPRSFNNLTLYLLTLELSRIHGKELVKNDQLLIQ